MPLPNYLQFRNAPIVLKLFAAASAYEVCRIAIQRMLPNDYHLQEAYEFLNPVEPYFISELGDALISLNIPQALGVQNYVPNKGLSISLAHSAGILVQGLARKVTEAEFQISWGINY